MTEVNNTAVTAMVTPFQSAKDEAGPLRRRARKFPFWHDVEHYWHSDWLGWTWAPAPS